MDSERIAVRVDVAVLNELGWSISENEVIERFVGRSHEFMVSEIETHFGRELPNDWEEEFQHLYQEALEAELTPVDGVFEALERITLPTCVASSGSHEKMRRTLGLTELYERFEGRIFSVSEVVNGKPAPDLFLHAAKSMGVEPSACAVVEDSGYGLQAARSAGMRPFGYAGGLNPASRLEGPGTVVFEHMKELPRLLTAEC